MAKILSYADCTLVAITNDDPRLCDCNKIVDTEDIPFPINQPDKQKDLSIKTDWKYLGETVYLFSRPLQLAGQKKLSPEDHFIAEKFPRAVFHPPQA
jgi:hypothetical protein